MRGGGDSRDATLLRHVREVAVRMAQAIYEQALDLMRPSLRGRSQRHHRRHQAVVPQAEAMVGFLNAYQLSASSISLKPQKRAGSSSSSTSSITSTANGSGWCRGRASLARNTTKSILEVSLPQQPRLP